MKNMEQGIQPQEQDNRIINRPEKKCNIIMMLIFFAVMIFAGVALFFSNKNNNEGGSRDVPIVKDEDIDGSETSKDLDVDLDGIPDYIEEMIGTNKDSADTDGDGYADFDEIKKGYDPTPSKKYTVEEMRTMENRFKAIDEAFYRLNFLDSISSSSTEAGYFSCGADTVSDIDNNIYNTVKIGEQCWLKENLKVAKNQAGDTITRYCYDNDPGICEADGGLYDWNTAMNNSTAEGAQGICPNEWHVPKDSEWHILESGLATQSCAAYAIDEAGTGLGCEPAGAKLIVGGSSGFEGFFAGYGSHSTASEAFYVRGDRTTFWSSTGSRETKDSTAWSFELSSGSSKTSRSEQAILLDFSVRCLKD